MTSNVKDLVRVLAARFAGPVFVRFVDEDFHARFRAFALVSALFLQSNVLFGKENDSLLVPVSCKVERFGIRRRKAAKECDIL